eukprot:4988483-Amphidinium_carterae.1
MACSDHICRSLLHAMGKSGSSRRVQYAIDCMKQDTQAAAEEAPHHPDYKCHSPFLSAQCMCFYRRYSKDPCRRR